MPLDREVVIARTLRRFGHPIIDVELTPEHINDAIDEAIQVFGRYVPRERFESLAVTSGTGRYLLTDYGRGVYDVEWKVTSPLADIGSAGIDDLVVFQDGVRSVGMDDLAYGLQYFEMASRLFSEEPEWDFPGDGYLYLYKIPTNVSSVTYYFFDNQTDSTISDDYVQWVERYARALCRLTLAEIRGKYSQIPAPGGGVQLNGQDLRSAADQEIAVLMEEIQGYAMRHTLPFFK